MKKIAQITLMFQTHQSAKRKTRPIELNRLHRFYLVCCKARGEGTFTMCTETDGELGFRSASEFDK